MSSDDPWGGAFRLKEAVRANQTANDVWDDCLTRFLGVNRTDGRCMDIIDRHGKVTAGQLAAESGLTTGAVTVVVDRLEAVGYVERKRDPDDRRKVWISITPIMAEMTERLFAHFQLIGPVVLERFTPDQIAAIIEFLEVSSTINIQHAELLEQYVDRKGGTPQARLVAARLFARAGEKQMKERIEALKKGRVPND
ncbi:MarR family winged helix-turn-helix transcriptional regulator [Devosia geojensis]|uniref:MarR family winged helix-turn-helix transcriptional regulator n=1 Tax=Devosia geojensis TaxID=443610 RepID=UPI0006982DE5|nr:MarR family transcriptional regulator [Devosia geojensis]